MRRTSEQLAFALCAVLAALALLVPAAQDVLALAAGHGHGHDGVHGGWVHRSADHARHDASQLESTDPVRHAECVLCAGRSRTIVPPVPAPQPATRSSASSALPAAASPQVATRSLRSSQPRAPPIL